MNRLLAGQGVVVKISAIDDAGTPIVASAVSYRVINQAGAEVIGETPVVDWVSTNTELQVTIAPEFNAITGVAKQELRVVLVSFTLDPLANAVAGVVVKEESYVIEAQDVLTVPSTSFQTYQEAVLTSFSVIGLSHWHTASKADRIAALAQARNSLCRFRFRYTFDGVQDHLVETEVGGGYAGLHRLDLYTASQFATLPQDFKDALNRAQVIEADALLNPDWDRREAGLVSEKIGESSETYRQSKPLNYGVSRRAYKEIARYVITSIHMGRA